jgi:predicted phage tail protein
MSVNKLAGACLIMFGIVNVLHEIAVRSTRRGEPGIAYAVVTALLFTLGAVLFLRRSAAQTTAPKAKGPSIFKD